MSQTASIDPDTQTLVTETEVAIIGAGPIGLELAVALRRAGIGFQIIEAGPIGQTMSWWAPQTRWFSSNERIAIAGVPLETPDQSKATREQYLAYLRAVAKQFQIRVRCFEKAVAIDRDASSFRITTQSNGGRQQIHCQRVILAIGGTDRPRKLGIEGEELPHVDGYLREPHRYFGRRVLVIGGRNSAVEAALRLHHAGAEVAISYRRSGLPVESIKYWLRPEIEGLIESGRIRAHFETEAIRITPSSVWLRGVAASEPNSDDPIVPATTAEPIEVEADEVLALIGYVQDQTLLRRAGVELVGPGCTPSFDPATMETNVPGIYIAGTAVAGTQSSHFQTFLENCHVHVTRILDHLSGSRSVGKQTPETRLSSPKQEILSPLEREIDAMPES